jgi:hypothetical protein
MAGGGEREVVDKKVTDSSDVYTLRWNDFVSSVKEEFRSIRLSGDYSDLTVFCEDGGVFRVHKLVLAISSDLLATVLRVSLKSTCMHLLGQ